MKRSITLTFVALFFALFFPPLSFAPNPQPPGQSPATPQTPAANPADVASIDHIIAALYDVISGPAGKKRDWDRFRLLFVPGARLIPTAPNRPAGGAGGAPPPGKGKDAPGGPAPRNIGPRAPPPFRGGGVFQ